MKKKINEYIMRLKHNYTLHYNIKKSEALQRKIFNMDCEMERCTLEKKFLVDRLNEVFEKIKKLSDVTVN